jgi:predicted ATP-dependent protease
MSVQSGWPLVRRRRRIDESRDYRGRLILVIPSTAAPHTMKFQGSDQYVATQDLMLAVNAAVTLKRPLLVKGEPGTGKTMLAEEVAAALNMPLLQWHIKSTTKAQQGLYEYDAVSRLRDSQLAGVNDEKVRTSATTSSRACCGRPSPPSSRWRC